MKHRLLVLGVGNEERGDDAIGILVARQLQQRLGHGARVACDAQTLWDVVEGSIRPEQLIIIDAALACDRLPCGTCQRIEFPHDAEAIAATRLCNTHNLNFLFLLKLAQQYGTLPKQVSIYAIGAEDFAPGRPLSRPLAESMVGITAAIEVEIARALAETGEQQEARSRGAG